MKFSRKKHIWPLLVTLMVGPYKWHTTHHLMMMHVSMKFHEILKEKGYI